jgi:hypothetical protein
MPPASGSLRSQAAHYGRRRFEQAAAPPATALRSVSIRITPPQQSNAGITRRAAPSVYLRMFVSAVGCMPLLDRVREHGYFQFLFHTLSVSGASSEALKSASFMIFVTITS